LFNLHSYLSLTLCSPAKATQDISTAGLVGTIESDDGEKALLIDLHRKECKYKCSCGKKFETIYDSRERCVRDFRYGPYRQSFLVFRQARVDCPACGVVTESLPWVGPRVGYTKRLEAAVALSCQEIRSLSAVARDYGLHWSTVKEIHKSALKAELPEVRNTSPRLIGVDEFAVRRNHRYGTVVADLEERSVPYVGKDRRKESLAAYYSALGKAKCRKIQAVAIDMWRPYEEATREHCPNAEIVYDPFHIISAYGRDVVDRVRMQEVAKAQDEDKKVIKGSRYLLLKNRSNLDSSRNEPARLADLLQQNERINIVYVLKDDLRCFWKFKRKGNAKSWFQGWYKRAKESGIALLERFADKLKTHLPGILSFCQYPINTGVIEGINNKIKVIKRVAFGYRDLEYFFLRIRGAFHRKPFHTSA